MAEHWHRRLLESKGALFAVLTTVGISVGGIVEIIPMFTTSYGPTSHMETEPMTPLEVAGRDIYIREGCYHCHSQMVRPFRSETLRYGTWSRAEEYRYDRPFLLGSRRIGPDLHRVGGKYPDAWHYEHMKDPRETTPGSVMPAYAWLHTSKIDPADIQASVRAQQIAGTPYTEQQVMDVPKDLEAQGSEIVARLEETGIEAEWNDEIVALVAYLQSLGQDRQPAWVADAAEEVE